MSDNTFVLNGEKQAVYGSAQFTLYSDPECTQVAKDIDGSEEAGAGRLLDGTGRVKFSNLRYGTYYLKETQTPDGFTGVGGSHSGDPEPGRHRHRRRQNPAKRGSPDSGQYHR